MLHGTPKPYHFRISGPRRLPMSLLTYLPERAFPSKLSPTKAPPSCVKSSRPCGGSWGLASENLGIPSTGLWSGLTTHLRECCENLYGKMGGIAPNGSPIFCSWLRKYPSLLAAWEHPERCPAHHDAGIHCPNLLHLEKDAGERDGPCQSEAAAIKARGRMEKGG